MTAYVIAELEITDEDAFKAYGPLVRASVEKYGGGYAVRGATVTALDGEAPKRVAMMTFENGAAARRWYQSPEYTAARPIRLKAAKSRMFIVE
jgi:uncharacterized protein (DUF1330 family)